MDPNALCTALHAVRLLRLDVEEFFDTLSDGLRDDHNDEGKENFGMELQAMLSTVHCRFRELEQSVNSLNPSPAGMVLYNSSYLTQESSADKQALYSPLVLSHKWTDKIHRYSSLAFSILSQNSLKKSQYSSVNKRKRTQVANHNLTSQQMDGFLAGMDRLFPDMIIGISRPFTTNVIMQVTLGRILHALIVFKGVMIEWILVKGYVESCTLDTDLSSESKYQVFRRINDHAHAATLYFSSGSMLPEMAARSFFGWLNSYITLFTATCKHCGKHLHDFFPPTWRDFRTLEPYHFECKP